MLEGKTKSWSKAHTQSNYPFPNFGTDALYFFLFFLDKVKFIDVSQWEAGHVYIQNKWALHVV